jgi:DNA-directed RNA polymerase specialized sigma24 family protein
MLPNDMLRSVAIAKMNGFKNGEIAGQLGVQTRTIDRKLRLIRECWCEIGNSVEPIG